MPNTTPARGSSREKLLDAAAELISQHGVQALTLEGVAAAAGVTKGGLIYHFKTKDELLGAFVERLMGQLDQRQRAKAAKRGDTKSALLLALVDETFDMPRGEKQLLTQMLSAASTHHHLLGPVSERPRIFQVMGARAFDRERVGHRLLAADPKKGAAQF